MIQYYVCLKYDKKILYQSAYSIETGVIHLSETWVSSFDSSTVSKLNFEYPSCMIIICKNVNEGIKEVLSQDKTHFIPKIDYLYETCKDLLVQTFFQNNEKKAFTALDFSNTELVSCCGALVKFLISSNLQVEEIKYFSRDKLNVDFNTLASLQVIQEDCHPSNIKNVGNSKEGLSLLALIDSTVTPQGRRKLKEILLMPFNRVDLIESRLDCIQFFLSYFTVTQEALRYMKLIGDVQSIIKKIKEARSLGSDWKKLFTSLKSFIDIYNIFKTTKIFPEIIGKFLMSPVDEFSRVYKILENCVEFDGHAMGIKQGISEDLDRQIKLSEDLEEIKYQIIKEEKKRLSYLQYSKLSITFIQGYGYLIEILFENSFPNQFNEKDYSFEFHNENSLYFRTPKTKVLDQNFGDLHVHIKEIENSIVLQIENEILKISNELVLASEIVAEIDVLFSFTFFARSYGLNRPCITDTQKIEIVNGRHLLVELWNELCIPNDCDLNEVHRIALITGPNFSGKSIYMKMVGIIVYLSHIGSYVPAEIAQIGVVDHLFSRFQSDESKLLSSFSKDLMQVSVALNNSVNKSLLIFDEFGRGTSISDGICILAALVQEIENNPKMNALITTHYSEVISMGLVQESSCLKFYSMEISNVSSLVFLYKLNKGACFNSYGLWCAKLAGIPSDIIERAKRIQDIILNISELKEFADHYKEKVNAVCALLEDLKEGETKDFCDHIFLLMKDLH